MGGGKGKNLKSAEQIAAREAFERATGKVGDR